MYRFIEQPNGSYIYNERGVVAKVVDKSAIARLIASGREYVDLATKENHISLGLRGIRCRKVKSSVLIGDPVRDVDESTVPPHSIVTTDKVVLDSCKVGEYACTAALLINGVAHFIICRSETIFSMNRVFLVSADSSGTSVIWVREVPHVLTEQEELAAKFRNLIGKHN